LFENLSGLIFTFGYVSMTSIPPKCIYAAGVTHNRACSCALN